MIPEIDVTAEERTAGRLAPEARETALSGLHEEGFVVLRNLVAREPLDELNDYLNEAYARFRSSGDKWWGGGRIIGHLQLHPPARRPYMHAKLLLNDIVYDLSEAAAGGPVRNVSYAGNANLPGSHPQYFHPDTGLDRAGSLVVNIPLTDVDERNGSIEIIPGTHRREFTFAEIEDAARSMDVLRVNSRAGDVLMRFPTLLHRGIANPAAKPRHMLSMWHAPVDSDMQGTGPIPIHPDCADLIHGQEARLNFVFSEEEYRPFNPNYFPTGLAGGAMETLYRYAPPVFSLIRRWKGGRAVR